MTDENESKHIFRVATAEEVRLAEELAFWEQAALAYGRAACSDNVGVPRTAARAAMFAECVVAQRREFVSRKPISKPESEPASPDGTHHHGSFRCYMALVDGKCALGAPDRILR